MQISAHTAPSTPRPACASPDYWDFGGEREPLMHRIHAYPAKFPAFITPKAVAYAQARGVTVNRIADIFCGCGTTALEAKRLGAPFWGCDINPVATLIAQVKSRDYQSARSEYGSRAPASGRNMVAAFCAMVRPRRRSGVAVAGRSLGSLGGVQARLRPPGRSGLRRHVVS